MAKPAEAIDIRSGKPLPPLAGDGGPPHHGLMEARVVKLETVVESLATKADVAEVRADLHKISSEMKGWFIATAVLVLVGMFTIANIMISNVRSLAPAPSYPAPAPEAQAAPAGQPPPPSPASKP